jgi:putative RNA 2'-phosphotransferase
VSPRRSRLPPPLAAGDVAHRQLGRLLTAALRHEPSRLGLAPDAQGWVEVEAVLAGLRREPAWANATRADLDAACASDVKTRLEIVDGRIRARYGHSLPVRLALPAATPPDRLYHGTAEASLAAILADGLKPMTRQFVHLSANLPQARAVGYRKSAQQPALLAVDAAQAARDGQVFHDAGDGVWLTAALAARYLSRVPGR